ncbi:polyprenol reductase 2-like [Impatiens glandulifera]|uniref:polyprenol reductase 2-like n=1 Tax=Impatiens glandulifera TaxID=253017 RepID=UPI001FB13D71|nr:polyprenol reductase 2-like [Impatiens glandulifera]
MEIGLTFLLRALWVAAILPILVASLPSSKLQSFHQLLLGFAKRGKIMQSSSYSFTLPQKHFCLFYILGVTWTTFLLATTSFYAYQTILFLYEPLELSSVASHLTGSSSSKHHVYAATSVDHRDIVVRSIFLLVLMETQVVRRLIETIYVFNYSPKARMHIFAFLAGIFFYIAAPLSLCCSIAPEVFKFMKNQVFQFIMVRESHVTSTTEFNLWELLILVLSVKWYSWIGMVIFFWGWLHQRTCHEILGSLRKRPGQEDEYVIPHGDWFKYVSSPHYLSEIVIYAGIVVASGSSDLTIWLLLAFVVVNLAFAAAETHRWYIRKFNNYPRKRFAIIPYVW